LSASRKEQMNQAEIADRARQLESVMRGLKQAKFTTQDASGLKDSEKYIMLMLATLNEGRPVTPTEIAKKLKVTLAAVTHHINALQERDLVSRAVSPDDRRVVLISLSAQGAEIVETLRISYWKKICGLVEYLGDKDSAELVDLIGKIAKYMEKAPGL